MSASPLASHAVLVVEDDPIIRAEAVDLAREAGFQAYEARDADEAIAILERRPEIRILFTDIEMPGGMDGLKLAHAVRDRWPPVQIIMVSGRINGAPTDMPDRSAFFAKPYDPNAILRTLAQFGGRIAG